MGQLNKSVADTCRPALVDNARRGALSQELSLVQHDKMISWIDFIDQMRCPQDSDPVFGNQVPHMLQDIGTRGDVETNGWFVKDQKARAVQQRPGNFDAAHLPSGEVPYLVIDAITELDAGQQLPDTYFRLTPAHSMERSVIHQILHDREIEVESS
jgi:hypothetical protein